MQLNKAIVIGATGGVGSRLVQMLTDQYSKSQVYATYRNDKDRNTIEEYGATPLQLDIATMDLQDINAKLQGFDQVFFTAGSGGNDVVNVDRDGAIKIGKALVETSPQAHYIVLSSIGVDQAEKMGKLEEYGKAKLQADNAILDMDLKSTIVRPGALTDDPEKGNIIVNTSKPGNKSLLDSFEQENVVNTRADVARVLLECSKIYGEDKKCRVFEMIAGNDKEAGKDTSSALKSLL